jgi:hypothetical protein
MIRQTSNVAYCYLYGWLLGCIPTLFRLAFAPCRRVYDSFFVNAPFYVFMDLRSKCSFKGMTYVTCVAICRQFM